MKILNFGSLNLDYVYEVDHLTIGGETQSSGGMQRFCGGKGLNQSIALARAGAQVYHAGCIGQDGAALRDTLAENSVNVSLVRTAGPTSGHAIIQVDKKGQNGILLYGGANQMVAPAFADEVLAQFAAGDWLLLQNEISCLSHIIDKASEKGMQIVLNPSPINATLQQLDLSKISMFILNEIEGEALAGTASPEDILSHFQQQYPAATVVLTLGKKGAVCQTGTQHPSGVQRASHGIYKVPVVDTTAAGDTFTGFFVAALTGGQPLDEALRRASVASSLAVSQPGASPSIPTLQAVLAANLQPV